MLLRDMTKTQINAAITARRRTAATYGIRARQAILCGNADLAERYARHATRMALCVVVMCNELYGESGWTADELELYFKLNVKYT